MDAKRLFLENLEQVERILGVLCRRNGLVGDDADDLRSWVHARLVDDDYAVFRKFRGHSSIATYLAVVLNNLARDFRNSRWGKWRASAKAKRLGSLAVWLEALVYRDELAPGVAFETILHAGTVDTTERELAVLLAEIPPRHRREMVGDAHLDHVDSGMRADTAVIRDQAEESMHRVWSAMEEALASLPAEDRVVVRMRFMDGFTVADIARHLRLPQKPLYARIERTVQRLRTVLEGMGIHTDEVMDALQEWRMVS